ncbi:MAG TPA: sensor histidine kinase [Candidatus Limnocylindria bacterium]|nr:sensor histidine kinase [Candidatus Limnocylindria bacterium]
MSRTSANLVLLGIVGAALAAITAFAPFIYAYPLATPLNPVFALATLIGELLWVAAMLAAYARYPAGRMWMLILAARVVAAVGVIWVVNTSLTWTVWHLSIGIGSVVFAHLVLAFPGGRLTTTFDRRLMGIAYGVLVVSRIGLALVWDPRSADCFPRCEVNPFVIWPSDQLAWLFGPGTSLLLPALAAGVVVSLWRRWRTASPAMRRTLLPVAIVAPLELGVASARVLASLSQDAWQSVGLVLATSPLAFLHAAIPAAFLAGILSTRLSRGAIADLAIELGQGVPLGGLRDTLARTVRDPTLVLAFPSPTGNGFVDGAGRPADVPNASGPTSGVARLEQDGELLAVLVFDPAVEIEDPGRVQAVVSVARMALENERLAAQVRAQLEEVRASRARIVDAADAERRRIERDLHDGAQQRLVALAMRLDQARGQVDGAGELIDATSDELLRAIAEVRDLAHGLHPTILTERGLAAAVESLAERTPIPVRARVTGERVTPEAEAAAYFLVAETVTNSVKHAGATEVTVEADLDHNDLEVTIIDDGRGGADPDRGSGLQGLIDRIGAVGGTLTIDSPPGGGTVLRARIPAQAR